MNNDPLDYKPLNREAYVMVKPEELARLQDENRRLRAFVKHVASGETMSPLSVGWAQFETYQQQAAALLAGTPAEDSELAALRRQVAVLKHDRVMLQNALLESVGVHEADRIMNDIRASTPKD